MNKNRRRGILLIIICIITTLLYGVFNKFYNDQDKKINLSMEVMSDNVDQYKVYYDLDGDKQWSEDNSDTESYKKADVLKKISFYIPAEAKNIRIDFGNYEGIVKVKNIELKNSKKIDINQSDLDTISYYQNQMELKFDGDEVLVEANGDDPYIVIEDVSNTFNSLLGRPSYLTPLLIVIALLLGLLTGNALKEAKNSLKFLRAAFSNKKLIVNLAKNDFKQKYATSYLGVIWGFINPLITIAVYWFVFQVGLRQGNVGDRPFILWFICGIIPWFFFQEGLSACSNVFIEYSYLVKKVVFKIETLPVIKIISTLFVHVFFIIFLIIISSIYGFFPNASMMQFIYYSFSMIVLVFCITIFTSAVMLFFRDLGQIIGIIINVGFWATPIGWNITMLPGVLQTIFKLNPMFYIVNGYRDAFLENIFFWQRPYQTLYFWSFCLVMFLIGVKVFNKLRPHFSDVL